MKSAINFVMGIFILLFTINIVMAVENYSIRQEELRQSVTSAVYTALAMTVTETEFIEGRMGKEKDTEELNQKMEDCFLNALKVLVKSDSKIQVSIRMADYKRGILDVDTKAVFTYWNGREGSITYRKTGILQ